MGCPFPGHAHDNAFFFYCLLIRIGYVNRALVAVQDAAFRQGGAVEQCMYTVESLYFGE